MEKSKIYKNSKFPLEAIKEATTIFDPIAIQIFEGRIKDRKKYSSQEIAEEYQKQLSKMMQIKLADISFKYDSDSEGEFFAEYRKFVMNPHNFFIYERSFLYSGGLRLNSYQGYDTEVSVRIYKSQSRSLIERIFDVFETYAPSAKLPITPSKKPKIFIGHGRSKVWRDLKDHLQDKHGHEVVAYEVGARAGHTIRDILEDMLTNSSFAVLVMTGEDETAEGKYRARQNVIHETGLFQGRLGFNRAIVLLEEGTEVFSNIQGIEQIRFSKGNIKETYGDILATIKREFY